MIVIIMMEWSRIVSIVLIVRPGVHWDGYICKHHWQQHPKSAAPAMVDPKLSWCYHYCCTCQQLVFTPLLPVHLFDGTTTTTAKMTTYIMSVMSVMSINKGYYSILHCNHTIIITINQYKQYDNLALLIL